jgi:cell wall-associated NlpC family hydrolase
MKDRRGRVTHVGIYAGGNDWWVAPRKGTTVRKQSIYSSRYSVGRVT